MHIVSAYSGNNSKIRQFELAQRRDQKSIEGRPLSKEQRRALKQICEQKSFLNADGGAISRSIIMHEMLLDKIKSMTLKLTNNLHNYPRDSGRVLKLS